MRRSARPAAIRCPTATPSRSRWSAPSRTTPKSRLRRGAVYSPPMAQIAEDLFLLLLDNASAQPGLDRRRRERVLSGAVLLDLAHACRIRPAMAGEQVEPGRLVALAVAGPIDPVVAPAFQLLQRKPLRPATAVKRLSKQTEQNLTIYLEQTGQIRRVRLTSKRFGHTYAFPLTNRERVGHARSALLAALFDRR